MINPLTGVPLTEAEHAKAVHRYAEAEQIWRELTDFARVAASRIDDPAQRRTAIGLQVVELAMANAMLNDPAEPESFLIGLIIGVLAVGADTVAGDNRG
jgi:hypothetical protein